MMNNMKKCCHCNKKLGLENFCKNKNNKDGLSSRCGKCSYKNVKKWRKNNPEKFEKYRKKYYEKNKEKIIKQQTQYNKEYFKQHADRRKFYGKSYREKNCTNTQFKLATSLRIRLCHAVNRKSKGGSAVNDLGCSIMEFIIYLEQQFQTGMTWDNWGIKGWHIDHKIPLNSFDLTDRSQFLVAVHYTNLQPLWAKDNLSKGCRMLDNEIHLTRTI